jgi:hypothetical protein
MQKALLQRNIQLSSGLSDGTGATGQRILRAIVAGERAPCTLAALRNDRCQKDADAIALALTGPWREEPLCVLTHALALCDFSTAQRRACDAHIARAVSVIKPRFEPTPADPAPVCAPTPPRRKPHSHSKHAPAVHTRAHLLRIPGVDVVAVHGLSDALAQTILAASTDMGKGPDDKTLAPG